MRAMLKCLYAVAFGIGLAVTSSARAHAYSYEDYRDAFPGTIYHVVSCTQNPAQCAAFNPTNGAPPANYLDGFNRQVFADYLASYGFQTSDELVASITGTAANGTVYGYLDDWDYGLHTQFIFQNGQVSCCIIDEPFRIDGLNDNGWYVGYDGEGEAYLSPYVDAYGVSNYLPYLPTFDAASQAFLFPENGASIPFDWEFLAIDNNNTILAENLDTDRNYLFVPKALIPEPGSSSMVVTGLIALLLFRKRWSRTFPTVR